VRRLLDVHHGLPVGRDLPGKKGNNAKAASKCDLCGMQWKEAPPCVENCPNQALKFEDRDAKKR
jgi:Fe-S-cluster-containing hydrogenase component 2